MDDRTRLIKLCIKAMENSGLMDDKHKARLKKELKEVDAQAEHEYLLDLHDRKVKYPENEHNLFIVYLLDICDSFNIDKEYAWLQGEFPDIDMDYIKDVRDYLKKIWAPDFFGRDKVCEIGTYGTLGIKSAMLDMARVFGLPREDIQNITSKMEDKYDDEGVTRNLDWDAALRLYDDFREYCEQNPKVAKYAKAALDRNRSAGVHAGGLIISDRRIDEFVPLEVRKVNKENPNGVICSAWTEGLANQDLQPVGLIKFDLLVIGNIEQISIACELVKQRHSECREKGICAFPGQWDWSDTSYLNDPKALGLADKGDLTCIFQFDGEGIQKLVKRGGVSSFDDLAAYSALYRPGPLNMGMDARYCKRKKGEEPYNLHPVLEQLLGKTYGVMVFQESVMDILRVVGRIPDMHTEKVRKAISKKKINQFIKYKDQFLKNGQQVLGVNIDFVKDLWGQIESFAEYGFNKSVPMYTKIITPQGLKEAKDFMAGDKVYCIDEQGDTVETDVVAVHDHGVLPAFEVTFDDGSYVECSIDHKFLTEKGQISLREICQTRSPILCDPQYRRDHGESQERRLEGKMWSCLAEQASASKSQEQLSKVQRGAFAGKTGEIQACHSLRAEMFEQSGISEPSPRMSEVQGIGLGWGDSQVSLWHGVFDLEGEGISSTRLRGVRRDQARKHSAENGEAEQRQPTSRQEENIFRDSKENICSTRDTGSTCRTASQVEEREPRKARQKHRSSLEKSETISHGNMVEGAIGLGDAKDSLRKESETSRFCERQDLDRSGWFLPFLRAPQQWPQSVSSSESSATRSDVEGGGVASWGCDVDPNRHDVLQEQFGGNEGRVVQTLAGHAPISDTRRLVPREIVRVRYVGKKRMCDLEVANPTHNFLLPNGVVTSNSHSYAYTYISSRLLYLKAHFPVEFYTAVLMHETEADKYKEYKLDAANHGVSVNPVHINKSKENFHIENDEIYFGFQNIKGIGYAVAERIVEEQPYKGFRDFLERFGTDAGVVYRLVSLGCFDEIEPDYDHVTLRRFHELYKDVATKRKQRQQRNKNRMIELDEKLRNELLTEMEEDHPDFEAMCKWDDRAQELWDEHLSMVGREVEYKSKGKIKTKMVTLHKIVMDIFNARERSIRTYEEKERFDVESPVTLDNFNPYNVKLKPEEVEILMAKRIKNGEVSYPDAESEFYGFQWVHELETSPDYSNKTIGAFLRAFEEKNHSKIYDMEKGIGVIEVQVVSATKRTNKRGTEFYTVVIEDANALQMKMTVWKEDFLRFREEFKKGKMLRLEARPPSGGYYTLTFHSVPKRERWRLPKNKEDDYRVVEMRQQVIEESKDIELENFQFDSSAVEGLEDL